MPKMFLLTYHFLDQEHQALVEVKKTKAGTRYHVMLLHDNLLEGPMQKVVMSAAALALPLSNKIRNIVDAIKIALFNETGTGLYK
jgi:hypothetical protein